MKRITMLLSIIVLISPVFAQTRFSNLHLNTENNLLFSAMSRNPALGDFSTLFISNLDTGRKEQLTFFPESIMLIEERQTLQIQNRFGVFRSDANLKNMSVIDEFPSFVHGSEIQHGKLTPISSSPDGKYLVYFEASSTTKGDLILLDVLKQKSHVVTRNIELNLRQAHALWSPDSSAFIYEKNQQLFYFRVSQLEGNRLIAEQFRKIGEGKLNSIRWSKQNDLFFVTLNLVYKIRNVELFTRSLYSELLQIGDVTGKIPFNFDPNFDEFWISPDGEKIMLNKGGQNLFIYFLQGDDFSHAETRGLPYLYLPRNTTVLNTVWSLNDRITLLTQRILDGKNQTELFTIQLDADKHTQYFENIKYDRIINIILSPDESKLAILQNDRIIIKDFNTLKLSHSIQFTQPLHLLWKSNTELIVAGMFSTELINIRNMVRQLVAVSQADSYGFSEKSSVQIKNPELTAEYSMGSMTIVDDFSVLEAAVANKDYRVYVEQNLIGSYQNMIMLRLVQSLGTRNLFNYPSRSYDSFPDKDAPVNFVQFNHGSRIRRREVSLVFNAIDTIEGLTHILNVLNEFNIRATFFVNGEFIRRHPDAVREIAKSGHEVGNLFFAYFDMTDPQYGIDKEFIMQGLARNEDMYFQATGHELSLLWHAPHYSVSSSIIEASKEMSYTYVGRDIDTQDWISPYGFYSSAALYKPSSYLVDQILDMKLPGSIIPIRIGIPGRGRDDYLFHYLDILINNLIKQGYEIVPVSTLMEHAK